MPKVEKIDFEGIFQRNAGHPRVPSKVLIIRNTKQPELRLMYPRRCQVVKDYPADSGARRKVISE